MDVRALRDKATQLFSKGKFAKAAEAYEEYCRADPKDHQARLRQGDAWAKVGKKDRAISAYTAAAEGFAREGFLPRAIAASKLVLEVDPSHTGVQKMLADLYARKSKPSGRSAPSTAPAAPAARSIELEVPPPQPPPAAKPPPPPPAPRADPPAPALEIDLDASASPGLDIEIDSSAGTSGEVEIPIESGLPSPSDLPPELQPFDEAPASVAPPAIAPIAPVVAATKPVDVAAALAAARRHLEVDSETLTASSLPPIDVPPAPPEIIPTAPQTAAPPGLRTKSGETAVVVPAPPPRVQAPPAFAPSPSRPQSDLERSLQAFIQADPDAPRPASAPAAALSAAFTELELEGESFLHAVDAAAQRGGAPAAHQEEEEIFEATEEVRLEPGSLPKIPLFSDLPPDAFIALFERCPLRRFDVGQQIIEQGTQGEAFYVICEGGVQVVRADGGARRTLAKLDEGAFFGEMALLSDAPRTASVEATSPDTQVLEISAAILQELSAQHPAVADALKKFCRQRLLSNLMATAPLFKPFATGDRRDLIQRFRARDVPRGAVLIKEGQLSDGLYVVLSGEVQVAVEQRPVATLKEGQVFGEMSLLTRSPATATVSAVRRTSLLRLPRTDFDALILSHPQILEHVAELTDERQKANAAGGLV